MAEHNDVPESAAGLAPGWEVRAVVVILLPLVVLVLFIGMLAGALLVVGLP